MSRAALQSCCKASLQVVLLGACTSKNPVSYDTSIESVGGRVGGTGRRSLALVPWRGRWRAVSCLWSDRLCHVHLLARLGIVFLQCTISAVNVVSSREVVGQYG